MTLALLPNLSPFEILVLLVLLLVVPVAALVVAYRMGKSAGRLEELTKHEPREGPKL